MCSSWVQSQGNRTSGCSQSPTELIRNETCIGISLLNNILAACENLHGRGVPTLYIFLTRLNQKMYNSLSTCGITAFFIFLLLQECVLLSPLLQLFFELGKLLGNLLPIGFEPRTLSRPLQVRIGHQIRAQLLVYLESSFLQNRDD